MGLENGGELARVAGAGDLEELPPRGELDGLRYKGVSGDLSRGETVYLSSTEDRKGLEVSVAADRFPYLSSAKQFSSYTPFSIGKSQNSDKVLNPIQQ